MLLTTECVLATHKDEKEPKMPMGGGPGGYGGGMGDMY
jgi:hypothetical protein